MKKYTEYGPLKISEASLPANRRTPKGLQPVIARPGFRPPDSVLPNPRFRRLLRGALVAGLVFVAFPAFPWGQDGHETIAKIAQTMLSNNVLAKVQSILDTNEMASVALWADQARQLTRYHNGPLTNSAEAHAFVTNHLDNGDWHFVDLPLKTAKYDYDSRFATNNDIVHTLTNCIAVLEGKSTFITTRQALRYLIHLVGDLHQPLHVACGYYVEKANGGPKLLKTPNAIANPAAHDRGANLLVWFTTNQINKITTNNFHAYWDGHMVTTVDTSAGNQRMTEILTNAIVANAKKWKTKGDPLEWPALWAKDSAKEANGAYAGVAFQAGSFKPDGTPQEIQIVGPASAYDDKQRERVTHQLARAAFHLAELLNRISWE